MLSSKLSSWKLGERDDCTEFIYPVCLLKFMISWVVFFIYFFTKSLNLQTYLQAYKLNSNPTNLPETFNYIYELTRKFMNLLASLQTYLETNKLTYKLTNF